MVRFHNDEALVRPQSRSRWACREFNSYDEHMTVIIVTYTRCRSALTNRSLPSNATGQRPALYAQARRACTAPTLNLSLRVEW